jgi:hypothetical protein
MAVYGIMALAELSWVVDHHEHARRYRQLRQNDQTQAEEDIATKITEDELEIQNDIVRCPRGFQHVRHAGKKSAIKG